MKHYKSVFENEQDLLKALIDIHLGGKDIECDQMYFKGNFYKNGVNKPVYRFDLNPQTPDCEQYDACNLRLKLGLEKLNSIIIDPPFLFGVHGKTKEFYSSKTHTIYKDFTELESNYNAIITEANAVLKKGGVLIFKCQDYTDSKTTFTHCMVYNFATKHGFYAKDLAILVKPNKITNPNLTQRQNPILPDTEKQKISAEIINILSYQQVITNQGINYTGEKDWALNKILALLDKTIKSKLEAVEGAVKGMDEEFIMKPNYSDMQNGIAFVPKKIVLDIINKHK